MSLRFTTAEIAEKYNRFARWYDYAEGLPELLGLSRLRRRLLHRVSGRVLEVAVGTGKNLKFYPTASRVAGLDLSREMLNAARERAAGPEMRVSFLLGDAEALPFDNRTFATVVSSLSSCTFSDPGRAVREMARVCKPGGRVLLLEHGRSHEKWLAGFQDRHADGFAGPLGCHWNREPQDIAREAGLKILHAERFFFGIFHMIEAMPC